MTKEQIETLLSLYKKAVANNLTAEMFSKEVLDAKIKLDRSFVESGKEDMNLGEYLEELNELIRTVYFIGSERYEEVHPKYALITTHCGRRTFIVNALYLGIPAEVVMSYTGHADYESMKPYIAIVDDLKRTSMSKFNI